MNQERMCRINYSLFITGNIFRDYNHFPLTDSSLGIFPITRLSLLFIAMSRNPLERYPMITYSRRMFLYSKLSQYVNLSVYTWGNVLAIIIIIPSKVVELKWIHAYGVHDSMGLWQNLSHQYAQRKLRLAYFEQWTLFCTWLDTIRSILSLTIFKSQIKYLVIGFVCNSLLSNRLISLNNWANQREGFVLHFLPFTEEMRLYKWQEIVPTTGFCKHIRTLSSLFNMVS
jgi:hypothetical protein